MKIKISDVTSLATTISTINSSVQPLDATLTAFAALSWSSGVQVPTFTAADTISFKAVGSSTGNLLDKAAGDSLYTAIAHATASATSSGHTMATSRILGRTSPSSGAIEELTVGGTLNLSGGTLSVASVPSALTINNSGSGASSGSTYNGSSSITLSHNSIGAAPLASPTFTGTVTTAASATGGAGINLPHGAAPTSPNNGDIWTTTAALLARINGATKTIAFTDSNITGSAASLTTGRTIGMSGDVSWTSASFDGSGNVSGTSTLATVNSNVGSFGSTSAVPVITVNGKGLVTAVSTASLGTAATQNTGTSGATVPLLNGTNTWSAAQTFSSNITLTTNATYVYGKTSGGTSTRMLGIAGTDVGYVGSIDTSIPLIVNGGGGTINLVGDTTTSGKLTTSASGTATAGINLPHGTAPSSPVNGDIWTTTSGLLVQINTATKTVAFTDSNITGSAATLTTGRTIGMTGDVSWTSASFNGSGNVTGTSTLATVNSNTGSFGSTSAIPVITVNGKGLITAVSTASLGTSATVNTGTSGANIPLLNGNLTWSGTNTFSAKVTTAASASGAAGLNVPHGAAPSSPTNGDIWTTTTALLAQINGSTKTIAFTDSNITGSAATLTTGRTIGMTGDLTWTSASFNGSGNVTGTGTLSTVNSNTGSFGSTSAVPVITVNGKGLITAVSTASLGTSATVNTGTSGATIPLLNGNVTWSGTATHSAKITTAASASGAAGFNIPHGTGPSSPVDGDIWTTTGGVLTRMNGSTKTFAFIDSDITGSAATLTTARNINGVAFNGSANITVGGASSAASTSYDEPVAQWLRWKNYGGSHCIIDASNSTDYDGSTISNTDPTVPWEATFPTLMGSNGTNTYGVRVDIAKKAESLVGSATAVGISASGQLTSTMTGSTTNAQIYLNGSTNNWINFAATGVAAPAFTTRSAGTKIVLYPNISGSAADYAFGIESSTLWSGLPTTTESFKWYGGTTLAMTLTGAGALTAVGNITAYSDETLKEDVATIRNALEKVCNMRGVTYTRIDTGEKSSGVIAQEFEQQAPELVHENADGIKSVAYGNTAGYLIEAVKELKGLLDELKAENAELRQKLNDLENRS